MIDWSARYEEMMMTANEETRNPSVGAGPDRALALAAEIREGIAAGLLASQEQPIPYVPEPLALIKGLRPFGVAAFRETFDDGDAAPAPPAFEPDCRECPHSYALHNDLAGCAALESGDGCECPNSKAILQQ